MTSKIVGIIFSFIFLLFTFATPVSAQTPTASASPLPTYISPLSPVYTEILINNMFHTFSCLAIGQSLDGQGCLSYQTTKNSQGALEKIPVISQVNLSGGVLGATAGLIDGLYTNPPVNTGRYIASVGKELGVIKEVHAQGVVGSGADVLDPIISLWQVSRNISYLIMIVIFVIIGLMVMFRNKINPQTVITAQAALPGLIIGLILITFSYFLAALVTDTAFVGTNLIGAYFQAAQNPAPTTNLADQVAPKNVLAIFSPFIGAVNQGHIIEAARTIFDNVGPDAQGFLRWFAAAMSFQFGSQVGHLVPVVGDLVSIGTGITASVVSASATPEILGFVLYYAAVATLIYSMLKLLLRLISNYLSIVFLVLTAPFTFLASSLPGRQGLATDWIRNLLANILAFPAVLAVFYFVAFLLGKSYGPFEVTGSPSFIGGASLPMLGGLNTNFINMLLAFGALTALPAIPDIISRTVGKLGAASQLLGQELSGSSKTGQGYASSQFQHGTSALSTIGQNYNKFRGADPNYSPALKSTLGARFPRLFGRKENN